mmetsp:Transcript_24909/g.36550  ORF Transcript_24909/g.36550 Transcript_24909/m.36550 type:complete len:1176 (-) Transcript_24909:62-3589(-)
MVSTGKLLLLAMLSAVTIIFGTAAIAISIILEQRKSNMKQKRKSSPKQQKPVPPFDPSKELNKHRRMAPNPLSPRTASDAHLSHAIQLATGGWSPYGNDFKLYSNAGSPLEDLSMGGGSTSSSSSFVESGGDSLLHRTWNGADNTLSNGNDWRSTILTLVQSSSVVRILLSPIMMMDHAISTLLHVHKSPRGGGGARSGGGNDGGASRKNDTEAYWHLNEAAELGNPHAQYALANSLVSGVFGNTKPSSGSISSSSMDDNVAHLPSVVPADFGEGGSALAKAIVLWHMSSIEGVMEAQMSLGYRYYMAYKESGDTSKKDDSGGASAYGVPGDCQTAMAYYEEAANAAMDELEASSLRGKVNPASDRHRLAEIYMHGASSALSHYNKPDELEEALEYYRIRASHAHDSNAAFTLANLHHYGLRGVRQDMRLALKYYEMAANNHLNKGENNILHDAHYTEHPEAAGQAAKFHLLGMGVEANANEALRYMRMGAPGGLEGCGQDKSNCDAEALNCFGLAHLFGIDLHVDANVRKAVRFFTLARDFGNVDAIYHLAMMRMGWMNMEENEEAEELKEVKETKEDKSETPPSDTSTETEEIVQMEIRLEQILEQKQRLQRMKQELSSAEKSDMLQYDSPKADQDGQTDHENQNADDSIPAAAAQAAATALGKTNVLTKNQSYLAKLKDKIQQLQKHVDENTEELDQDIQLLTNNAKLHQQKQVKVNYIHSQLHSDYYNDDSTQKTNNQQKSAPINLKPSSSSAKKHKIDYSRALNDFLRAANKGHLQSIHRAGIMYARGIGTSKNCPAAVQYLRQVSESSPSITKRIRSAYRYYKNGNIDLSLRNYIAAAEAGVELAQSNAAWLLERGYCLGLDKQGCVNASLRMWKAASRQGNAEASLRVGDFHYYGRLDDVANRDKSATTAGVGLYKFDWPFLIPLLTHPEQWLIRARMTAVKMVKKTLHSKKRSGLPPAPKSQATSPPPDDQTCSPDENETCETTNKLIKNPTTVSEKSIQEQNFNKAAQYYRKAADAMSPSANFNLGFMYEWGLGLKQDFPLAKRHYDLAASNHPEAGLAVKLALMAMNFHEKWVKLDMQYNIADGLMGLESRLTRVFFFNSLTRMISGKTSMMEEEEDEVLKTKRRNVLMSHLFSSEMALVAVLIVIFIGLMRNVLRKRRVEAVAE